MKQLIFIVTLFMSTNLGLTIDFGTEKAGDDWRIVNDGVMGGLSTSKTTILEDSIVFTGEVSLENNGGFASIRTLITAGALNDCKTMTMLFKSNSTDRTFGLSLKNSQQYYIPYYKYTFTPKTTDWDTITINLSDFKHYRISEVIGNTMPIKALDDVYNIALIISDKKAGNFNIEIDYIKFE
ncbi:CIA30 family protein [Olleya sp. Ti.3.14]|uniref:CIA30 family protein n=1 Tax=Olleya sp. Ti.3.14 TaxID=3121297 RepID=UPI00311F02FA